MQKLTFIIACLLTFNLHAQDFQERDLSTSIKKVTVFLESAQIDREGSTALGAGKFKVKIKNLSPYLDAQSVQVKANGPVTVLGVNHVIDYLDEIKPSDEIKTLQTQLEKLQNQQREKQNQQTVLSEQKEFLKQNRSVIGQNGIKVEDLRLADNYFGQRLSDIYAKELEVGLAMQKLDLEINKIIDQLNYINGQVRTPSSSLVITVLAKEVATVKFELSYLVRNAGWFPNYDVRVENLDKPMELIYKASVYQSTGEDWKNIKLIFSTADPSRSGQLPDLQPWRLDYYSPKYNSNSYDGQRSFNRVNGRVTSSEDGSALPGVNVIIKGTSIGAATDMNGNYSLSLSSGASTLQFSAVGFVTQEVVIGSRSVIDVMMDLDVRQLSEVVTTTKGFRSKSLSYSVGATEKVTLRGAASIPIETNLIENQTSVQFEIKEPYTILSNGERSAIDMVAYDIPAYYEYVSVPKLDPEAFLIARITGWEQYNLLEGEANLFFEGTFVGKSVLDVKFVSDTLSLSLGRDKNVVVTRTKVKDFSNKQFIGSNKIDSRTWALEVRNKKSNAINITLNDQIPMSVREEITVENVQLSGGKLDAETGEVVWKMELKPNETKKFELKYSVKYPKGKNIYLD